MMAMSDVMADRETPSPRLNTGAKGYAKRLAVLNTRRKKVVPAMGRKIDDWFVACVGFIGFWGSIQLIAHRKPMAFVPP